MLRALLLLLALSPGWPAFAQEPPPYAGTWLSLQRQDVLFIAADGRFASYVPLLGAMIIGSVVGEDEREAVLYIDGERHWLRWEPSGNLMVLQPSAGDPIEFLKFRKPPE